MAQTSNLLFPGPAKSKMAQASNLLFPSPGKSKMVQTSNFAFSRPGKKQIGSLSRKSKLDKLAFAKPEKSNYSRELDKAPGSKQKVVGSSLPGAACFQAGEGNLPPQIAFQIGRSFIFLFPGPGKSKLEV